MPKTGEAYIKSPEKRAFEVAIISGTSPFIGVIALGSVAAIGSAEHSTHILHDTERSLYPGNKFTMRKLGDPDSPKRILKICRQAMIDELPQTIDILRGTMSLIGPRADKPAHIERLFGAIENPETREKWQEARAAQKPGVISSYAIHSHAHNPQGDSEMVRFSEDELLSRNALLRAELDIADFEQASLRNDTQLLLNTGAMVLTNYSRYAHQIFQK